MQKKNSQRNFQKFQKNFFCSINHFLFFEKKPTSTFALQALQNFRTGEMNCNTCFGFFPLYLKYGRPHIYSWKYDVSLQHFFLPFQKLTPKHMPKSVGHKLQPGVAPAFQAWENQEFQGNTEKQVFFNSPFDKGRLKTIVCWFFEKHGQYKTLKLLEKLKEFGFGFSTMAGISLGIDDLQIPKQKIALLAKAETKVAKDLSDYRNAKITGIERIQRLIYTWNQTNDTIKQEVVKHFEQTDLFNPIYMMAFSGARGNMSQVRQLVGMRGLMSDPQGQIIDFPIQSNFREGLTLTEYLISTYGARKGIVDTALRTATAGYLTRRLVDVAQHTIVSHFDCGTMRGIFLFDMKEGKKTIYSFENRLIGRVLAQNIHGFLSSSQENGQIAFRNQEIDSKLAHAIAKVTKKAFVRSPLTCETSRFVCQLCYGWSFSHGKLVSVGEAVGIIAAQSIGEPGTQLTMRTFHTGGVFAGGLTDQIFAPFDGKIQYIQNIPGSCVRTSLNELAFFTKMPGSFFIQKKETVQISSKKQKSGEVFRIPAYALLFCRNNEFVQKKQVLAQFSTVLKKVQYGSAEQTLFSTFAGEFVFGNSIFAQSKKVFLSDFQKKNIFNLWDQKNEKNNKMNIFENQKQNLLLEKRKGDFSEIEKKSDSLWKLQNWSSIWILSGKIFSNSFESKFWVQEGDSLKKNSVLNQILWKKKRKYQYSLILKEKNTFFPFPLHGSGIEKKKQQKVSYFFIVENSKKFSRNFFETSIFLNSKKKFQSSILFQGKEKALFAGQKNFFKKNSFLLNQSISKKAAASFSQNGSIFQQISLPSKNNKQVAFLQGKMKKLKKRKNKFLAPKEETFFYTFKKNKSSLPRSSFSLFTLVPEAVEKKQIKTKKISLFFSKILKQQEKRTEIFFLQNKSTRFFNKFQKKPISFDPSNLSIKNKKNGSKFLTVHKKSYKNFLNFIFFKFANKRKNKFFSSFLNILTYSKIFQISQKFGFFSFLSREKKFKKSFQKSTIPVSFSVFERNEIYFVHKKGYVSSKEKAMFSIFSDKKFVKREIFQKMKEGEKKTIHFFLSDFQFPVSFLKNKKQNFEKFLHSFSKKQHQKNIFSTFFQKKNKKISKFILLKKILFKISVEKIRYRNFAYSSSFLNLLNNKNFYQTNSFDEKNAFRTFSTLKQNETGFQVERNPGKFENNLFFGNEHLFGKKFPSFFTYCFLKNSQTSAPPHSDQTPAPSGKGLGLGKGRGTKTNGLFHLFSFQEDFKTNQLEYFLFFYSTKDQESFLKIDFLNRKKQKEKDFQKNSYFNDVLNFSNLSTKRKAAKKSKICFLFVPSSRKMGTVTLKKSNSVIPQVKTVHSFYEVPRKNVSENKKKIFILRINTFSFLSSSLFSLLRFWCTKKETKIFKIWQINKAKISSIFYFSKKKEQNSKNSIQFLEFQKEKLKEQIFKRFFQSFFFMKNTKNFVFSNFSFESQQFSKQSFLNIQKRQKNILLFQNYTKELFWLLQENLLVSTFEILKRASVFPSSYQKNKSESFVFQKKFFKKEEHETLLNQQFFLQFKKKPFLSFVNRQGKKQQMFFDFDGFAKISKIQKFPNFSTFQKKNMTILKLNPIQQQLSFMSSSISHRRQKNKKQTKKRFQKNFGLKFQKKILHSAFSVQTKKLVLLYKIQKFFLKNSSFSAYGMKKFKTFFKNKNIGKKKFLFAKTINNQSFTCLPFQKFKSKKRNFLNCKKFKKQKMNNFGVLENFQSQSQKNVVQKFGKLSQQKVFLKIQPAWPYVPFFSFSVMNSHKKILKQGSFIGNDLLFEQKNIFSEIGIFEKKILTFSQFKQNSFQTRGAKRLFFQKSVHLIQKRNFSTLFQADQISLSKNGNKFSIAKIKENDSNSIFMFRFSLKNSSKGLEAFSGNGHSKKSNHEFIPLFYYKNKNHPVLKKNSLPFLRRAWGSEENGFSKFGHSFSEPTQTELRNAFTITFPTQILSFPKTKKDIAQKKEKNKTILNDKFSFVAKSIYKNKNCRYISLMVFLEKRQALQKTFQFSSYNFRAGGEKTKKQFLQFFRPFQYKLLENPKNSKKFFQNVQNQSFSQNFSHSVHNDIKNSLELYKKYHSTLLNCQTKAKVFFDVGGKQKKKTEIEFLSDFEKMYFSESTSQSFKKRKIEQRKLKKSFQQKMNDFKNNHNTFKEKQKKSVQRKKDSFLKFEERKQKKTAFRIFLKKTSSFDISQKQNIKNSFLTIKNSKNFISNFPIQFLPLLVSFSHFSQAQFISRDKNFDFPMLETNIVQNTLQYCICEKKAAFVDQKFVSFPFFENFGQQFSFWRNKDKMNFLLSSPNIGAKVQTNFVFFSAFHTGAKALPFREPFRERSVDSQVFENQKPLFFKNSLFKKNKDFYGNTKILSPYEGELLSMLTHEMNWWGKASKISTLQKLETLFTIVTKKDLFSVQFPVVSTSEGISFMEPFPFALKTGSISHADFVSQQKQNSENIVFDNENCENQKFFLHSGPKQKNLEKLYKILFDSQSKNDFSSIFFSFSQKDKMKKSSNQNKTKISSFVTKYENKFYTFQNLTVGYPTLSKNPRLGNFVFYGDCFFNSAIRKPGQIIHLSFKKMTLRRGQPFLVSLNGILHFSKIPYIQKNVPVVTLPYQTVQAGDIVQGIPKVEQFFEARTTLQGRLFVSSLPILLKGIFERYKVFLPLEQATRQSFLKIQQIIVDGVQRVYRSQGVSITDKHLEIVVRQMTTKVQILHGAQTGFFPGELINLDFVERINKFLMVKIRYEPVILGITRASLEVESFLSASSFQQTTKILSLAAISRKKDFLKGLKENLLVGNLIPAGTGFFTLTKNG